MKYLCMLKGDITESEYLPFDLLLLELAAFQVAPHHPLIDFFTEFVKKISELSKLLSVKTPMRDDLLHLFGKFGNGHLLSRLSLFLLP